MFKEEIKGEFPKWYNRSLKLLSFRPHSIKEVTDYLLKKKVAPPLISKVIAQLTERKLLDDRAFAGWFVESRIAFRPRSPRVLQGELAQKGIAREVINEVLETQLNTEVELAGALKLAQKKLRLIKNLPDRERLLKIKSYLWQKGYGSDVVEKTLENLKTRQLTNQV